VIRFLTDSSNENTRKKDPDLNDLLFPAGTKTMAPIYFVKNIRDSSSFPFFFPCYHSSNNPDTAGYLLFSRTGLDINSDELFSVEYTFIPSPDDDLNSLAKALAKPPAPLRGGSGSSRFGGS